jgi:putative tricarboxylic transport membrane protein
MRRYYQAAGVLALALAVYVMVESRTTLNYYTEYGPGPGFLPFWCGVLLAGFSAAWLFQVSLRPVEVPPEGFVPPRAGLVRVVSVIGALLAFALLMGVIGFLLAMLLFLWFLLLRIGGRKHLTSLLLALAGSTAFTYLFRNRLDVPLPLSAFDFLRNLGL